MQKKTFGQKSRFGVPKQHALKMPKIHGSLRATIKRTTKALLLASRESIPLDMLTSDYLPYQASKTYRTIVSESDCRRAQITSEVQQSLRRL